MLIILYDGPKGKIFGRLRRHNLVFHNIFTPNHIKIVEISFFERLRRLFYSSPLFFFCFRPFPFIFSRNIKGSDHHIVPVICQYFWRNFRNFRKTYYMLDLLSRRRRFTSKSQSHTIFRSEHLIGYLPTRPEISLGCLRSCSVKPTMSWVKSFGDSVRNVCKSLSEPVATAARAGKWLSQQHQKCYKHDFGRKIEILEIGSDGLWGLPGVFHRVSEQFRTRLRSGEREKSIEHESDPSRLSFAQYQPTKSEFDHRNSSLKYGIEQNYILSQKAVEGHSYGSRDKDSKERSTKHPKETSNLQI